MYFQLSLATISLSDSFTDYLDNIKTILIRFNTKHHLSSQCALRVQSSCKIYCGNILNNDKELSMEVRNIITNGVQHMEFQINNPNKTEIKLKLEIGYYYSDKIRLEISDGSEQPNFSVEYGSNYDDVDSGSLVIARGSIPATRMSDNKFGTSSIILDETLLFPDMIHA